MFFTVLPHGRRVPAGSRMKAFLLTDNWDDWFTYSTMYSLASMTRTARTSLPAGSSSDSLG